MAPSASGQEELFLWSPCSADYLDAFLSCIACFLITLQLCIYSSSGNGVCLNDLPIGGRLNASSALEGVNFDADAQCRAAYGPQQGFIQLTLQYRYLHIQVLISNISNCVHVFGASLPLVRTASPEMYLQQMGATVYSYIYLEQV